MTDRPYAPPGRHISVLRGNLAPEAQAGGAIAVVREGDRVTIHPEERSITLDASDAEIADRFARWTAPEPNYPRGVLGKYTRLVGSASKGAVTS